MNFLYRNLSIKQLVILGLLIPFLCTVLIGWLQWQSITDMLRTRELVRHTRGVQVALGVFRYSLSDVESCQFRYILTHNEVNLDLYRKLLASASDQLKLLRSLTADNPTQQKFLDRIESLFNDKVRVTEQSLSMEQSGNHAGALQTAGAEESRINMLDIETAVEDMQTVEAQLLFQRQNIYQHNFKVASALSLLSMALCLAFIIAILLLLRRLAQLQSFVTLCALTEMIEYEGGMMTIEDYLRRRRQALATHGPAQIEAERILGLLERRKLRPMAD